MHLHRTLVALLAFAAGLGDASQAPLTPPLVAGAQPSWLSRPWNERPNGDATGNLVFQSLSSLLQLMPNSQHPFGHTIVRATIPKGTLLHHGTYLGSCPSMDWITFDLEHAIMFAFGRNGTLFTYTATRDIQLVYYDGCSGNKMAGVVDTQDLLIWGEPGRRGRIEDWVTDEMDRLVEGCAWAKQYGIDGFMRMEFDLYGLELVSSMSTVNVIADWQPSQPSVTTVHNSQSSDDPTWKPPPQGPRLPPDQCSTEATFHGISRGKLSEESHWGGSGQAAGRGNPFSTPEGWKGTLPDLDVEAFHAGVWHNQFPGELRVHADASSMITLFDPSLTSLVDARRSMTRDEYRPAGLSKVDIARVRADIADVMAREPSAGGGVDWQGLARVIQERFGDRLPYMRHLLHQPVANATAQLARVRKQLLISLIPHMHREDIGTSEWFADTAHRCAALFTAPLPRADFTKQERVLCHAVEEVLHEVCRVYTEAWVDAFDAEAKPATVVRGYLEKWRGQFDSLVEWLDWPIWIKCDPACGADERCWVSQGFPWTPDIDHTPRCIPPDFERSPPNFA